MIKITKYDKYIEKVSKFYSHDSEKYHTIYHVKTLFYMYDCCRYEFLSEFPDLNENALFWTIAWHDSVYIIGNKLNEKFSGELYIEEMKRPIYGYSIVFDAILSTKIGTTEFKNPIQKVMHDLDWSGFMDYDTMVENEKKILYEATCNGLYTVDFAKQNQKKFYESFANKDIYITKAFQKFNEIARENLQKRIVEM